MSSAAVEQWQEFGSLIKSLRQTHGWTLRYVAREIPISSSYQSNIESGQVAPPSDRIILTFPFVIRSGHPSGRAADGP
jgi:ribosome-binding protein aMBF1 (putative translation factor)